MRSPSSPLLLLSFALLALVFAPQSASALRLLNVTTTGNVSQSSPSWAIIDSQLVTNVSHVASITIRFVQGANVQPNPDSQVVAFFADSQPMPTGTNVTCEQIVAASILSVPLSSYSAPYRYAIAGAKPRRWTVVVANCPNYTLAVQSFQLDWTGVIDPTDPQDCVPGLTCAAGRQASAGNAAMTAVSLALLALAASFL